MKRRRVRSFSFSYTPAPYLVGSIIPTVPLFEPEPRTNFLGLGNPAWTPPQRRTECHHLVPILPDDPVPEASENRGFTRQQWTRRGFYAGQVGFAFFVIRNAHVEGVFQFGSRFAEWSIRNQSSEIYTAFTAFVTLPATLGCLFKTFYPAEFTPRVRFSDVGEFVIDCAVYTALGYVGIRWFRHSEAVREWLHPNGAFWQGRLVPVLLLCVTKEVIVSRTMIFADRPYDGILEPLNRFARNLTARVWSFVEYL